MPEYDFLYLGDNARAPYGPLPFNIVYKNTLEAVKWFFKQGCSLVVLACNTASAKALRTIQQIDLPQIAPSKRVLGVIRPTAEVIGNYSKTNHVGVMGTQGTISSGSYQLEIEKFFPEIMVVQEACPSWVELVESNRQHTPEATAEVEKHISNLLKADSHIDALLLACTHYPLLIDEIVKAVPPGVNIITQGELIARSLKEYLGRHPEIDAKLSRQSTLEFCTTGDPLTFDNHSTIFFGSPVHCSHAEL